LLPSSTTRTSKSCVTLSISDATVRTISSIVCWSLYAGKKAVSEIRSTADGMVAHPNLTENREAPRMTQITQIGALETISMRRSVLSASSAALPCSHLRLERYRELSEISPRSWCFAAERYEEGCGRIRAAALVLKK